MGIPTTVNYPTSLDTEATLFGKPINQAEFTLASGIDDAVTSFVVNEVITSVDVPTFLAFETGELVYAEAKTDGSKTFSTVTRGSVPQAHLAGEKIRLVLAAEYICQFRDAIIALETELGIAPSGAFDDVADAIADYVAFKATKAAASGLASLNGSSKVVEDPVNATATPTASKIPIADGSGLLNGWVSAMSTTVAGKVEAAIASEVNTGTDATRAVTPDSLAGSNLGIRYVSFALNGSTSLTTSDVAYWRIPAGYAGMNLVSVKASVGTGAAGASSSGDPTFTVTNVTDGTAMLSTSLTVDVSEYSSDTDAHQAVIDTTKDDVVLDDLIKVAVTTAGTGVTFAVVTLGFQLP